MILLQYTCRGRISKSNAFQISETSSGKSLHVILIWSRKIIKVFVSYKTAHIIVFITYISHRFCKEWVQSVILTECPHVSAPSVTS